MIYCQCLGVCKCFSNVESLSWAFCTELCRTLQFCSDSAGFWVELHFLQNIFIGGTVCLPGQMFWTCSGNVCVHANFDTTKMVLFLFVIIVIFLIIVIILSSLLSFSSLSLLLLLIGILVLAVILFLISLVLVAIVIVCCCCLCWVDCCHCFVFPNSPLLFCFVFCLQLWQAVFCFSCLRLQSATYVACFCHACWWLFCFFCWTHSSQASIVFLLCHKVWLFLFCFLPLNRPCRLIICFPACRDMLFVVLLFSACSCKHR